MEGGSSRSRRIQRINKTFSHLVSREIYSIVRLNCGCNLFWLLVSRRRRSCSSSSARTRIAFIGGGIGGAAAAGDGGSI